MFTVLGTGSWNINCLKEHKRERLMVCTSMKYETLVHSVLLDASKHQLLGKEKYHCSLELNPVAVQKAALSHLWPATGMGEKCVMVKAMHVSQVKIISYNVPADCQSTLTQERRQTRDARQRFLRLVLVTFSARSSKCLHTECDKPSLQRNQLRASLLASFGHFPHCTGPMQRRQTFGLQKVSQVQFPLHTGIQILNCTT